MSDFLSNFSGENYENTRQEKLYDKEKKKKKRPKSKSAITESAIPVVEKKANQQENSKKMIVVKKKKINEIQAGDVPYGPVNVILDEDFEKRAEQRAEQRKVTSQKAASLATQSEIKDSRNEWSDEEKGTASQKAEKDFDLSEEMGAASHKLTTKMVDLEPKLESGTSSIHEEEVIETDPTYKKKKRKKYLIIGIVSVVVASLLFFTYYQVTHVVVPNFKGKELADARSWSTENDVQLKVEQKYDFKTEANVILKQSITKKKIKKGNELIVEASLGPDPEEVVPLPDFKKMKVKEAKNWISENKADNLVIIEEYSDTIAANDFIKLEMTTKDVKAETYKRKDKGKMYFSKGKEVYEKNISVPDFAGKTKEEATEWTKKNEIQLKLEEEDSNTVENGKVISQSVAKDQKMAKKEMLTIKVSTGKALLVPDFSQYTLQEAEGKTDGIQVQIKQTFNDTVPYGRFIGQSVAVGTKYSEKSEKPTVQATYSAGKPFLKDLRNNTLEGDLQKIFYDEYQSKGANITYQVYYVDSEATKGTVVQMSRYNEFVPTDAIIQIGISRGNIQPSEAKQQLDEPNLKPKDTE